MAFEIRITGDAITVELRGLDRAFNWRRRITFHHGQAAASSVRDRASLERAIDHRALGIGTHDGAKRPNRRRVGSMLGRDATRQAVLGGAVRSGAKDQRLLVLDLDNHEFARAVLAVDAPDEVIDRISGRSSA